MTITAFHKFSLFSRESTPNSKKYPILAERLMNRPFLVWLAGTTVDDRKMVTMGLILSTSRGEKSIIQGPVQRTVQFADANLSVKGGDSTYCICDRVCVLSGVSCKCVP